MISLTRIAIFSLRRAWKYFWGKKYVTNATYRNEYIAHGIDERGFISPYISPALKFTGHLF